MKYKLYTTNGAEIMATYIKLAKNHMETGYEVGITDFKGHTAPFFYKTGEIATIMQIKETK